MRAYHFPSGLTNLMQCIQNMQLLILLKGENFSAHTENFQCVELGINTGGTSDLRFYDWLV